MKYDVPFYGPRLVAFIMGTQLEQCGATRIVLEATKGGGEEEERPHHFCLGIRHGLEAVQEIYKVFKCQF